MSSASVTRAFQAQSQSELRKQRSTYLPQSCRLVEIPLESLQSHIVVLEVRAVASTTAAPQAVLHRACAAVIGRGGHVCFYVMEAWNVAAMAARTVAIDPVALARMGMVRVAEGVEAGGERVEGRGRRHEGKGCRMASRGL